MVVRSTDEVQEAARLAARYLAVLWPLPCADAWEESPEHVHTSTLAAIEAGLEAAVSLDQRLADEPEIAAARAAIGDRLSTAGGAFTKWSGSTAVDASLLWMAAPYELLVPTEPRFAATLSRIECRAHQRRRRACIATARTPTMGAAPGRSSRPPMDGSCCAAGRRATSSGHGPPCAGSSAQADERGPAARAGRRSRLRPRAHRGVARTLGRIGPSTALVACRLPGALRRAVSARAGGRGRDPARAGGWHSAWPRRPMRPPSIVAFGPRRPWAKPGESITVDVELALDPRLPAEFAVALVDLDREIVRLNGRAPADSSGRDGSRQRFSVDCVACRRRPPRLRASAPCVRGWADRRGHRRPSRRSTAGGSHPATPP